MTPPSEFVIWDAAATPHACVLKGLSGVEDEWELDEGVPRLATLTSPASLRMDPERPYHTILEDNVANIHNLLVVSDRLKRFLEQRGLGSVEYLPAVLVDHKGRDVRREYFIVHPIEPVEALDLAASGAAWSEIDPESIDTVEHLVVDETKVDPGRGLFRLRHFHDVTLIRRDLAEALVQEGFTGLRWVELSDYPEI